MMHPDTIYDDMISWIDDKWFAVCAIEGHFAASDQCGAIAAEDKMVG
jgi:hypothetical protein